jgi:hypothetical protein
VFSVRLECEGFKFQNNEDDRESFSQSRLGLVSRGLVSDRNHAGKKD